MDQDVTVSYKFIRVISWFYTLQIHYIVLWFTLILYVTEIRECIIDSVSMLQ